jgi:hypothetical protein
MFGILWENRQNPRIWLKSSHLGPPERYSQQRCEWIFPDSSPGASPAVDLAAFDQRAFEPVMMSEAAVISTAMGAEAAAGLIEPRAEP